MATGGEPEYQLDDRKKFHQPIVAVSFIPAYKLFVEAEGLVTFDVAKRLPGLLTKQILPIVSKSAPSFEGCEITS